ncbi:MAG: acyl-CoA/acyl-ACP dehydrogenase [Rhodobacteraceae bacterium]|nr:acyl-CoA/acyl-ACP dehydrogenase [Paracoccaceae bacterium]
MKIDLQSIAQELAPEFKATAEQFDENDEFAHSNYALLREKGVFTALPPTKYGGAGVSHSQMCEFVRTIAHACPSTALSLSMHQHLVSAAIFNDAAGRPGRKLLEKVTQDGVVLISTGANDWLESNGSAKRVDGGFEVTAMKPFASGSPGGDIIVTSVAYDDPREGPQVLHFPVSLKAKGITLTGDWKTIGMRATGSQTIKFDRVFIPDEAIVMRRPRGGFFTPFAIVLTVAMPLIMSAYTGVAEAAAEIAREKARDRAGDPVTPFLVGEMENLLTTAQLARADMVRMANDLEFEPSVEMASQILTRKTICANNIIAASEKAMEVVGGASFYRKLGLERWLRDAHGSQYHPLPEKRQQLFTGRLSMGLEPVPQADTPNLRVVA